MGKPTGSLKTLSVDSRVALREQVYKRLKDEILSGVLATGTRLREIELSAHYGVSRTPVREVLQRLQSEGLVVRAGKAGMKVLNLSDRDIEELFELRLALETVAAESAARVIDDHLLDQLAEIVVKTEAAAEDEDVPSLIKLNEGFHLSIAGASRNARMIETLRGIHSTLNVFRRSLFSNTTEVESSTRGHRFVLHALRAAKDGLIQPTTFGQIVADHVSAASSSYWLERRHIERDAS